MFPILEAGPSLEGATLPAFVVARDGLYLRKRSLLGLSQTKVARVAHLPAEQEFLDYALPKVSADLMARVVGFFRAVYRRHGSEAIVLLIWDESRFNVLVPAQKVSSASVTFDLDDGDPPSESRVVGTIHSHGSFGAFASSVDEDDESGLDGLHVVVGDLDKRRLSYSAAIVVDGVRFHMKAGSLIERPRRLAEPPEEWLAKVKLAPPRRLHQPNGPASGLSGHLRVPGSKTTRPSRTELEAVLAKAGETAVALGYRLSYWLVPVSGASAKGGTVDG